MKAVKSLLLNNFLMYLCFRQGQSNLSVRVFLMRSGHPSQLLWVSLTRFVGGGHLFISVMTVKSINQLSNWHLLITDSD